MKYIKSIDQYSNKFEVLLDSIVEIMDQYNIIEYEEDDEWNPPDCTYYEYSYNHDGSIRQINISNINSIDYGDPLEILKSLRSTFLTNPHVFHIKKQKNLFSLK